MGRYSSLQAFTGYLNEHGYAIAKMEYFFYGERYGKASCYFPSFELKSIGDMMPHIIDKRYITGLTPVRVHTSLRDGSPRALKSYSERCVLASEVATALERMPKMARHRIYAEWVEVGKE